MAPTHLPMFPARLRSLLQRHFSDAGFTRRMVSFFRVLWNSRVLIRAMGIGEFWRIVAQFLEEDGGIRRLDHWCRERVAFENRHDKKKYLAWLAEDPQACVSSRPELELVEYGASGSRFRTQILNSNSDYVLLKPIYTLVYDHAVDQMIVHSKEKQATIVYADEDSAIAPGLRSPTFKPEFSIDLFLYEDFVGPLLLLETETVRSLVHDNPSVVDHYSLILSAFERGTTIKRCPVIAAAYPDVRCSTLTASQADTRIKYYKRKYGDTFGNCLAHLSGSSYLSNRKVSVVIPTKDRRDLLSRCIESVASAAEYLDLEIIILNNRSEDPKTLLWLEEACSLYPQLSVIDADYEFNWSRLNNHGSRTARGDVLVFLNNDIETNSRDWISKLVLHALREDVGAVGSLLLYPTGEIQHAGVVIGIGGFADHVYACIPADQSAIHQFTSPFTPRNVLACTGACLVVEKRKFDALGGFDERLKICGDIDFCLRLANAGFSNVYEGRVSLVHHESATRSRDPVSEEEMRIVNEQAAPLVYEGDPFYNPNLSLDLRYPTFFKRSVS